MPQLKDREPSADQFINTGDTENPFETLLAECANDPVCPILLINIPETY